MMLATLMTLLNSFWTKYGNFEQCCQEGYECGGTIADKSQLGPASFFLFLEPKLSEVGTKIPSNRIPKTTL